MGRLARFIDNFVSMRVGLRASAGFATAMMLPPAAEMICTPFRGEVQELCGDCTSKALDSKIEFEFEFGLKWATCSAAGALLFGLSLASSEM